MFDDLKQLQQKRQLEYFVACVSPKIKYQPVSGNTRVEQWQEFCKRHYIRIKNISMVKFGDNPEKVEFMLSGGLSIVDHGEKVTFAATKSKEDIKLRTVLPIIYNVGSYLMRRGWSNGDIEISTNRAGSNEMVEIFQQSIKDTRIKMNQELLAQLSKKKQNTVSI